MRFGGKGGGQGFFRTDDRPKSPTTAESTELRRFCFPSFRRYSLTVAHNRLQMW
jgi:hypothetical protein